MQALRSIYVLAFLLSSFTVAYADGFVAEPLPADSPIPANSLVIDYEGTIFEVSEAPEYAVGDRLAGRLRVDLSVRLDPFSGSGNSRTYSSGDPSFVRGFWIPGGDGFDEIFIADELTRSGDDKRVDIFSVEDLWVARNGSLDGARRFNLNATLYDFLDDASLDQSFEVTSADVDEPHERRDAKARSPRLPVSAIGASRAIRSRSNSTFAPRLSAARATEFSRRS